GGGRAPNGARRSHRARARSAHAPRARALQQRDRRDARRRGDGREYTRGPRPRQARSTRPRPSCCRRLRNRSRPARHARPNVNRDGGAVTELRVSGLESLPLATELLQRARLTDSEAGVWEAADLQWWWRTPRPSDAIDQHFWIDDAGPVAGVVLTDWGSAWGCDLIVVPGATTVPLSALWRRAVEAIDALGIESVDVLVDNDKAELVDLLASAG